MNGQTKKSAGRKLFFFYASLIGAAFLMAASAIDTAAAEGVLPPKCEGGSPEAGCFKEIRVVNNTNKKIWVVIQASIIVQPALSKPLNGDKWGGPCDGTGTNPQLGDPWLQRALEYTSWVTGSPSPQKKKTWPALCFPVKNDYYLYVNPTTGVAPGATVSVLIPWWAHINRDKNANLDEFVDWWNAGRIYILDDQNAASESYQASLLIANSRATNSDIKLAYLSDGPQPSCTPKRPSDQFTNVCVATELAAYRAGPVNVGGLKPPKIIDNSLGKHIPYQLNEYTLASVDKPAVGGVLRNLGVNYNVSNVDQVYLPIAMAPINGPADAGYMGTTLNVTDFRKAMQNFAGTDANGNPPVNQQTKQYDPSLLKWPIYNNPQQDPKNLNSPRKYPNAGIRVPSTFAALAFYASPGMFVDQGKTVPEIVPLPTPYSFTPPESWRTLPLTFRNVLVNWENCAEKPNAALCPLIGWYNGLWATFDINYSLYLSKCTPAATPYLLPRRTARGRQLPSLEAYLQFVHGWVPFRVGPNCGTAQVPDLPPVENPPTLGGYVVINYQEIQYDFMNFANNPVLKPIEGRQFNKYVEFIHGPQPNFLDASAYAYSIDDLQSFQHFPGDGLVFTIGGGNGLPNQNKIPPKPPLPAQWYLFTVTFGGLKNPPQPPIVRWKKFGICKPAPDYTPDWEFVNKTNPDGIGLDARLLPQQPQGCVISAEDEKGKIYRFKIKKYDITAPAFPIHVWPNFTPHAPVVFDPNVIDCSVSPPDTAAWCAQINEVAKASVGNTPPQYTISTPVPIGNPP